MKKKLFLVAAIVICVAILASGTAAYFTAVGTARNVITSGAVDVQIEEWQKTDEGLVPYPTDEPVLIMPGSVVSKIVQVKNLEAESYIRAKFNVSVTFANVPAGEQPPVLEPGVIQVPVNEENWIRVEGLGKDILLRYIAHLLSIVLCLHIAYDAAYLLSFGIIVEQQR